MSKDIVERHGAVPYCFYFTTRSRGKHDFDSKLIKRSNNYYINCRIITLDELKKLNDPKDSILIRNMEINKYDKIVQTIGGWKWTQPFEKGDVLI